MQRKSRKQRCHDVKNTATSTLICWVYPLTCGEFFVMLCGVASFLFKDGTENFESNEDATSLIDRYCLSTRTESAVGLTTAFYNLLTKFRLDIYRERASEWPV